MTDVTAYDKVLDGHSDALGSLQQRVEALEAQLQSQREEMRQALLDTLYELRDDSDFSRPMWASGIAHVAEHLATEQGRKVIQSDGVKTLAQRWADVIQEHWTDKLARKLFAVVLLAMGTAVLILLVKVGAFR